jgi:CHAT domain
MAEHGGDGAFTLQAAMAELVAETWDDRWSVLARHPELLHESVARALAEGDPLLGLVVLSAAEVGLDAVRSTFEVAHDVFEVAVGDVGGAEALVRVEAGVKVIFSDEGVWVGPAVDAAIRRLRGDVAGEDLERLQRLRLAYLRRVTGVSQDVVADAYRLATTDWPDVWAELANLPNLTELVTAALVLQTLAAEFDPNGQLADRACDVVDLLRAATERGHQAAAEEHRLVLNVRSVFADGDLTIEERADACAGLAANCGGYSQRTGARWVLRASIDAGRQAVECTPAKHPNRAERVSNLGNRLSEAVQAGVLDRSVLVEAVEWQREAVECTPAGHPNRSERVSNLAGLLSQAVEAGVLDRSVLAEAVEWQREAVECTPAGHPNRSGCVSILGCLLSQAVLAGVADRLVLVEAVDLAREAVERTPAEHPSRAMYVSNLGSWLAEAVQAGVLDRSVLAEAVESQREAVERTPAEHPSRALYMSNLGSLLSYGVRAGVLDRSAYRKAVDLLREAVGCTRAEHPNRAMYVSNLGNLLSEAVQAGVLDRSVLAEAVVLQRKAVDCTPAEHPKRAMYVSNLGNLLSGAVQAGVLDRSVLVEAVEWQREAVDCTPAGHPDRAGYVSNLGNRLFEAVQARTLDRSAYRKAVEWQREAVECTPAGHPDRAGYVSNLGGLLSQAARAGVLGRSVLVEAVEWQREAVECTPAEHPNRAAYVSNLGSALSGAVQAGVLDRSVLVEAVKWQREAVECTPAGHPNRARCVSNLGSRLAEAVQAGVLLPADVVGGGEGLVDHVWDIVRRYGAGGRMRRVLLGNLRGAISAAPWLEYWAGNTTAAIECVEASRNHLFGIRTDPTDDQLPAAHRVRYREARAAVEQAETRLRDSLGSDSDVASCRDRLNAIIDTIRAETGFETFGSRPTLTDIARHIDDGELLVYLLPGDTGGIALTVDSSANVSTIALPDMSTANAAEHLPTLFSRTPDITTVAAWLWTTIAQPLLEHLPPGPLVIVPTGVLALLPLHAAGSETTGWLDDHRTIRILPSALSGATPTRPDAPGPDLVMISHAQDLFFLNADLAVATNLNPAAKPLKGPTATVNAALHAIAKANQVVISGHGTYNVQDGAGISLIDGTLTADAIARLPPLNRSIAILNACVTSQVSTELPDEAIGLPNALLAGGFHGIYATQWPVQDAVAFVTSAHLQQTMNPEQSPAQTMQATRTWLRHLTSQDLKQWIQQLEQTIELPVNRDALNNWLANHTNTNNNRPFQDPANWAAFTYIGH